ncbi:hypothetical protein AB8O55_24760 [Saccharopolyspora cebuensis]|uniref:Uncharacterized protein n=1 Tax=Saccharopolyspora cebuensis TaxID=418759 RepID=A0ABV4CNF3_9PSEU
MVESTSTRGRRPRRSTRISQQLERARQRNADQLAAQREREQRVDDALAEFVDAGEHIATEETTCEEKVAALQRRIDQTRAASREKVAGEHARQARAALAIHEAGRTVEQVAELLELRSEKEARRLIAAGREGTGPEAVSRSDEPGAESPDRSPRDAAAGPSGSAGASAAVSGSLEGGSGNEVDGQQHRPSGESVPVAADGGQHP